MRKPHISIARAVGTKAMLASLASLAVFSLAGALGGCEHNNKPPMTPDGPEMDVDAAAPPPVGTSPAPKGTTGAVPSARVNPG